MQDVFGKEIDELLKLGLIEKPTSPSFRRTRVRESYASPNADACSAIKSLCGLCKCEINHASLSSKSREQYVSGLSCPRVNSSRAVLFPDHQRRDICICVPARGQIFHVPMIGCDKDKQIVVHCFHESAQHAVECFHQSDRRVHLLFVTCVVACPIFKQREVIALSQARQVCVQPDAGTSRARRGIPASSASLHR